MRIKVTNLQLTTKDTAAIQSGGDFSLSCDNYFFWDDLDAVFGQVLGRIVTVVVDGVSCFVSVPSIRLHI